MVFFSHSSIIQKFEYRSLWNVALRKRRFALSVAKPMAIIFPSKGNWYFSLLTGIYVSPQLATNA
ncbi:hypothetical protein [Burkholderia vietnamiensis]|uniref:hypothetical protein n=1 Tax=Burkholderia vietnamiensis TaxID=60552 RepID=UPI001B9331F3|nr:hypothetical protein [Burkholderia vietnamiensis]MBR8051502.1 hypothetical protein [Burkholderia vietnamiensis]MBR8151357.1 hypothetical protein [Burkholderia vietnamiensis]